MASKPLTGLGGLGSLSGASKPLDIGDSSAGGTQGPLSETTGQPPLDIANPVLDAAKRIAANFSYSSHPIQNYKIGPYQFEKGLIQFVDDAESAASEKAQAFEALLATLPIHESAKVIKLDVAAAEQFVARKLRPGATSGIDSSTGERASAAGELGPIVGTGDLAAQLMATLNDGKSNPQPPSDGLTPPSNLGGNATS